MRERHQWLHLNEAKRPMLEFLSEKMRKLLAAPMRTFLRLKQLLPTRAVVALRSIEGVTQ